MNAYEFTQALRRQKWSLLGGVGIMVVLMIALLFKVEDWRVVSRISPKYEAQVQIAVVPRGVDSYDDPSLATEGLSGIASIYGVLLLSPEAALEIGEEQDTEVLEIRISTQARSPIIDVSVDADSPEGAERAALGSFAWLETRLAEAPEPIDLSIVTTTQATTTTTTIPTEARVPILINLEPVYPTADPELWFEIETSATEGFATSLPRLVDGSTFRSNVRPDRPIAFILGPETGDPHATVSVVIPDFPDDFDAGYSLEIRLRRGLILFEEDAPPDLDGSRILIQWLRTSVIPPAPTLPPPPEPTAASLLLLTEDPVAELSGALRAPILITGLLTIGTILLLLFAVTRDTMQRTRLELDRRRVRARFGNPLGDDASPPGGGNPAQD